jgi:NAD(P)-dependent dehydrogenase (short-subunit alcohol dehydrogenase family)
MRELFSESLVGKTIAITGGNSGLGKEAAIALAGRGAKILILCRPSKKTDDALIEIRKRSKGNGVVEAVALDLADLASVRACAAEISNKTTCLDVLMNNAGIMTLPTRQVP